jgi:hypothetical protein
MGKVSEKRKDMHCAPPAVDRRTDEAGYATR